MPDPKEKTIEDKEKKDVEQEKIQADETSESEETEKNKPSSETEKSTPSSDAEKNKAASQSSDKNQPAGKQTEQKPKKKKKSRGFLGTIKYLKRKREHKKQKERAEDPLDLGELFETDEEKLVRTYVEGKDKQIKELKEKAEEQKKAVGKASRKKHKKIADIEERDKHLAESEAALQKQNTSIDSARFEIDSITKSKENLIASKKTKSIMEKELEEKRQKAAIDVETAQKAVEERTEAINELQGKDKEDSDEETIKKQQEELAQEEADLKEKQAALEEAESQKKQVSDEIQEIAELIARYEEQLKQKKEDLKKQEEQYEKDNTGYNQEKSEQDERKKAEWYQKYAEEKEKLDALDKEIAEHEEDVAAVQNGDNTRFQFKTTGEGIYERTVMMDLEKGEGHYLGDEDSEDAVFVEENKLEQGLKNAPILKDLNKDELPKYIGYNPKTGEMGGTIKEDGKENQAAKENQEKPKEGEAEKAEESDKASGDEKESKLVDQILSHGTTAYVDKKLKPTVGFEPVKTIVTDLRDNGMQKMHKTVIDIMSKIRDNKTAETSNASQIMSLIITSLDVLLDGDEGENLAADMEAKLGGMLETKIKKQTIYSLILSGLNLKKVKKEPEKEQTAEDTASGEQTEPQEQSETPSPTEEATQPSETTQPSEANETKEKVKKTGLQKATDFIADNKKNVKGISKVVENSIDTHKMLGEAKAFKGKNDQFARMLEGAYRQKVGDTTAGAINTGLNIARSAVNMFTGIDQGSILSKVVNGAFTGVGMLTDKVASAIAQTRDKSQVLNAPEVLGNIKYEEKKVPEYKFNQILKRVSGITSKDGLYDVIKVTDAVTLHSNMKANKADPIVGRVMSDLGYNDMTQFSKVRVTDILAKTGHPTGDWRGELKKSMVDDGQTQEKTFGQKVKSFAGKAWDGIKGMFSKKQTVDAD